MNDKPRAGDQDTLARAQATIERQQEEIERLKRRLSDERFSEDLREALALATAAGTIASPMGHARLLEMIVETAAHVISARAAALFLIDEGASSKILGKHPDLTIFQMKAVLRALAANVSRDGAGRGYLEAKPIQAGGDGPSPRRW